MLVEVELLPQGTYSSFPPQGGGWLDLPDHMIINNILFKVFSLYLGKRQL